MTQLSLGASAASAIARAAEQLRSRESKVLADKDPEDLHQMRIGMRRLRTALTAYSAAIEVPASLKDRHLAAIGRELGKQRDLDVMLETLEAVYAPQLPEKERQRLQATSKQLHERRRRAHKGVRKTLKGKSYARCQQDLQAWLSEPRYTAIARAPMLEVLPDLLAPTVSRLLMHPGWWAIASAAEIQGEAAAILLTRAEVLHDLRKQAKRSRYQMELFAATGMEIDRRCRQQVKQVQSVLGEVQDGCVLADVLDRVCKGKFRRHLPTLDRLLTERSAQQWEAICTLSETFLDPASRQELRTALLVPKVETAPASGDRSRAEVLS